ncbi:restriction endonuclease subunit S [Bacillus altitudinis]|uniref:restriction endonuclease subunit S n=1 Tax=Bacillus altitudinis TaxID=293387 RepID=UPI003D202680
MRPLFELEKTAINVDWNVLKIKRVLDTPITDGPHETPELLDEGIPFLSAESVKKGKIDFNLKRGYISREDHEKYIKKCKPQRDDIFMIKSGATTGNVAMVETDEEFSIWSPLALIRADKEIIQPKYLYYFIGSAAFREQVEISWSFGTQQNIGMKVIENLFISIPPLHLQEKLVHYIEKKVVQIDKLIEMKELNIKLLQQQRQSIITEAVTKGLNPNVKMKDSGVKWIGEIPKHWDIKKIKHITQVKRGASPRPIDDPKYFDDDGEYAWVRIADVSRAGMYLNETSQIMSELGASLSIKQYPGDLFVSIAGTVGKPCISNIKCCIHDGFVYFSNYKYNKKFLYYIFACGQSYKGLGKMGTQLNLNTDTIGEIKIPWPSAKEQEDIISKLEEDVNKVDKLIELINYQIEKLKEYRQALIYEAVTGKIDVRDMELDEVR